MADWLNIAGGAGAGYVQGTEDNRRREEFNALQRQRLRVEQQQKMDDELQATLKQVRPAGTYEDETTANPNAPLHESGLGVDAGPITKKKTVVTEADAARAQANAFARSGRPQDIATSAALRTQAYQAQQMARQEKTAKSQEVFTTAGQMNATGNSVGAMRHLAQAYDQVPDGHKIAITDVNGVPHAGIAGPNGEYITRPEPITAQSVNDMIQKGVMMTSPELMVKGQELGMQQGMLDVHKEANRIAQTNADTAYKKAMFETGDEAKAKIAAEVEYMKAHAWYMRNRAPGGAGGGETYGTPIPMVDEAGNPTYGIPTKKGTGGPGITPITLPAGWSFQKPQPVMNDQQKLAYTELLKMDSAGTFDGKGGGAKRAQFIASNGLDKFMQPDPITQKLRDSKDPDKAAPAKAGETPPAPESPKPAPKAKADPRAEFDRMEKEAQRKKREAYINRPKTDQTTPEALDAQMNAWAAKQGR